MSKKKIIKKELENRYVIRKIVVATSIEDALVKEKKSPVLGVELVYSAPAKLDSPIGFAASQIGEYNPNER